MERTCHGDQPEEAVPFLTALVIVCLEEGCKDVTLETLQTHVPSPFPPGTKIVSKREVKGLCELIVNVRGRNLSFYLGKDFVILDQMFSHKENISLQESERLQAKQFLALRKEVEKVVAISYTPGPKAQYTVYMFTDPLCHWCRKASLQIKEVADTYNVAVKVIFYAYKGKEEAIEVVCRKLDLSAYLKEDWKKEKKTKDYQCEEGKKLVEASMNLCKKLGVSGVPAFYLDNGKKVVGANIPQLKQTLSNLTAKKGKGKIIPAEATAHTKKTRPIINPADTFMNLFTFYHSINHLSG